MGFVRIFFIYLEYIILTNINFIIRENNRNKKFIF